MGADGTGKEVRIVAARSGLQLAEGLARSLGAPLELLLTQRFENENLLCSAADLDVAGRDVVFVATSCSPVSEHLLELCFGLAALRAAGPWRLTAVVAYLPYVRSDRPESPGAPVPAQQVADWIERAGADRVLTFDLHAPQIAGFFRIPVFDLEAHDVLAGAVREWDLEAPTVASPDLGGAKRAATFARSLEAPLVLMHKRREGRRTVALDLMGDVRGRTVLLVDDEIATGSTILSAASLVLDRGARAVVVAATHGVFAGGAPARLEASAVQRIVVTDTVPSAAEARGSKVEVISIVPTLAAALRV